MSPCATGCPSPRTPSSRRGFPFGLKALRPSTILGPHAEARRLIPLDELNAPTTCQSPLVLTLTLILVVALAEPSA